MQASFEIHSLEELLSTIEKSAFQAIPAVSIYYNILKTLIDSSDEKAYANAKNIFSENIVLFSKKEQHDIYTFLQNYNIKKLNTGSQNFLTELFDNYNAMLDRQILIENNTIAHSDFKNIVTIALRLDKFEWTENFIENYKEFLDREFKENAITYNLSRLYYSRKDYKGVLRLIQQVEFIDVYYQLDAKVLLLKIYYDTEAEESLFSLFSSFKIFLKRNKQISDYQFVIYSNFIKYTRRLFQIKMGGKGKIKELELALLKDNKVADLQWLNLKIEEFGNVKNNLK